MKIPTAPTRILTRSAFRVALMPARLAPPAWAAVVIVKGSFRLKPGEAMEWLGDKERKHFSGGQRIGDPVSGAPIAPTDFAPAKTAGDFVVKGTCHAPDGKPTAAVRVGVAVDGVWKHLDVFGDRAWSGPARSVASRPEPFTTMPLDWTRAYGGPDDRSNPHGRGLAAFGSPDGSQTHPLPNVEDPRALVTAPGAAVPPAGFGPLDIGMHGRTAPKGSFGNNWVRTRWPGLPEEFDWSFFNVAPPDQRRNGFFRGDEALAFEHMNPDLPMFDTVLPGIRPRILVRLHRGAGEVRGDDDDVVDLSPSLDTVFVDMDEGIASLVWRDAVEVADLFKSDLADVYLAEERVADPPLPLADHVRAMLTLAAEADANSPAGRRKARAEKRRQREEARQAAAAAPAPEASGAGETADDTPKARDPVVEMIAAELQKSVDAFRQAGVPEDVIAMIGPDMDVAAFDAAVREAIGQPEPAEEPPPDAWIDDFRAKALETGADESALDELLDQFRTKPQPEEAAGEEAPAGPVPWTPKRVAAHHAGGGSFEGEDLSGLDLSGLDLAGASMAAADLSKARLAGTNLAGADLKKADLSNVSADEIVLAGAALAGADLSAAELSGARLAEADFTGARLRGAVLRKADARKAVFERADLSTADLEKAAFHDAQMKDCDLTAAKLRKTDFRRAVLASALIERAEGDKTVFIEADLTGLKAGRGVVLTRALLVHARGPKSTFAGANLEGVDMRYADLPRADFTNARLVDARAHAVELTSGVLKGANLGRADFTVANLFKANLMGAILAGTNLEGANAFAAEFWEAHLVETRVAGANLGRTKVIDANFDYPGAVHE